MEHINIVKDLPFEIVSSANDFFISVDDFDLIADCKYFAVLFKRILFIFSNGRSPILSAEIPAAWIGRVASSSKLLFAKIDASGVCLSREIVRSDYNLSFLVDQ